MSALAQPAKPIVALVDQAFPKKLQKGEQIVWCSWRE
jgi:hypothetical protein